jgi:HEAT repeat protein
MAKRSPYAIAANLSSLLHLARHEPGAEEELREGVRVLLSAMAEGGLTVEATVGWLAIDGHRLPTGAPGAREVNEQLLAHNVLRVELPAATDPGDLLATIRTLAAYPGAHATWDDLIASLGPAAERVMLVAAGSELSFIQHDEAEATTTLGGSGTSDYSDFVDEGGLILPSLELVSPETPTATGARGAGRRREDPAVLSRLIDRGRSADDAGDYVALLEVARDFIESADHAVSEASARAYRLELKRLLSRKHIAQFAKLAALGAHREVATEVLRRLGSEATEVLMDLLVDTDSLVERRGYYSALTRMDDGTEVIIHHLQHPVWYVARNAAELCGEMALTKAVPQLAAQATHPDERVRKSVAVALNRIGTREAIEPLGRMLKDPSPAIRLQVLGNFDGARARPLAMPLAALLETEEDPDVLREILRTLGRIGTPDALLALRRVAQGEARRLGRRGRLQAIEALQVAGTAAAQLLRGLSQDSDPEIAEAATRALEGAPA